MADEPADQARSPESGPWGSLDRAYLRHLQSVPANDDGPIWLVELAMCSVPDLPALEHLEPSADAPPFEVVLLGDAVAHANDDRPPWTSVRVTKMNSRRASRALLDTILPRPTSSTSPHDVPNAGAAPVPNVMVTAIPTPSMPVPAHLTVPRWSDVAHPASDDDSPVVVAHFVRYTDTDWAPETLAAYAQTLAEASVPEGARSTRWFAVEGTVLGNGCHWDDIRFTAYPSKAAFAAVQACLAEDPMFHEHRRSLIDESYTLVLRPTIDRVARSVID